MALTHGLEEELDLAFAAADADPANAVGLVVVAERLRDAGENEEAANVTRRAVDRNPTDTRLLVRAAALLRAIGDHAGSSELLQSVIDLDPADLNARFQLGLCLLAIRDYRGALDQLSIYVRLAPDVALGWRNHAGALEALGEFHRALASANRGLLLEANNVEFRLHRAGLLNHLGRTTEALADIRIAETFEGTSARVAWFYSVVYENAGDLDQAIEFARASTLQAPGNPDLTRYLADLEKRKGFVRERIAPPIEDHSEENDRPERRKRPIPPPTWDNAAVSQGRVILALLLRDVKTRYGETRIGYLWALLEPISHLALIASVFSATHLGGYAPIGSNIVVYYFTGVLPYLLFSNTIFGVQQSLKASRPLLQVPLVQHVDVFLARGLLELITQFCVAVIVLVAFATLGLPSAPNNVTDAASGLFFLWLVGFGIGVTNASIMHFVKSWDHIFANVVRALYFTSGIFLNPIEMPDWVREILVWNPVLQGIDWVRSGFFETWDPIWLNRPYVVMWGIGTLMIGFGLERVCRRRLTVA
ncbi:ABC-type polysaccharide/polyol phosphate export permease [Enhydrobacter aerosaccus]|uniref:ABC-type polysaccharide/polyol phosphate export permease n=1 Tax=Enhydrobacter aerosaccus TaxID=225324 RepID=A0A1T4SDC1_9HYPH|nr:ABC transporter permease [Enhydrobacter aerosaccus]SKA25841.1 ABC-type polysaccharide/polyol phosphate export permease [Enhydrobacter aerosaccus]